MKKFSPSTGSQRFTFPSIISLNCSSLIGQWNKRDSQWESYLHLQVRSAPPSPASHLLTEVLSLVSEISMTANKKVFFIYRFAALHLPQHHLSEIAVVLLVSEISMTANKKVFPVYSFAALHLPQHHLSELQFSYWSVK
jgi:hypothetical protein